MKKSCCTIAIVMAAALSCKKTETEPLQLNADKTSLSLTCLKESVDSFQIQTRGPWTLTVQNAASAAWLQVSQMSGTGKTTVYVKNGEENLSGTFKQASLELALTGTTDIPSVVLTVTQQRFDYRALTSKVIGGSKRDVVSATASGDDGNVVLVGYSNSNDGDVSGTKGNYDYWIAKTDTAGKLQWKKNYGGSKDDYATCVQRLPSGGYLVGGYTQSTDVDVTKNRGFTDAWLVRLDEQGNKLWQQTYGGSYYDYINALAIQSDGTCILAGTTLSTNDDIPGVHGASDGWVLKVDANGTKLWSKTYGGTSMDFLSSIAVVNGGYIAVGQSSSTDGDLTNNKGSDDVWAIRLDVDGNPLWSKNFGGTLSDNALQVITVPDGGFLFAANTASENGDVQQHIGGSDGWLFKTDANGNLLWSKIIGGSKNENGLIVIARKNGGFLISQTTESTDGEMAPNKGRTDFWLAALNNEGTILWKRTMGGTDKEYDPTLLRLPDNHYVLLGSTTSEDGDIGTGHGDFEIWFHHFKEE